MEVASAQPSAEAAFFYCPLWRSLEEFRPLKNKSAKGATSPLPSTQQFAPPLDIVTSERDEKLPQRLIDKAEVLRRVPVTYVTLWTWMQEDKFPRSRNIGGKSAWLEHEIEAWIKARPKVPLKGENQQKAEA